MSGLEGGVSEYRVYRSFSSQGPFLPISDPVMPTGDGSRYVVVDYLRGPDSGAGGVAFYKVQVEEASGETSFSGTTAATMPVRLNKKHRDD